MKILALAISGALSGVLLVLISGAFTMMASAAEGGAAVNPFTGEISIAGAGPHAAVGPLIGLAVAGAVFSAGTMLASVYLDMRPALAFTLALALTVLACVVVSYTAWEVGLASPDSDRTPFEGGWVRDGGRSPVPQITMVIAAAAIPLRHLFLRFARRHDRDGVATQEA